MLDVSVWTLRRWLRKLDVEARLYVRHWIGFNGRLYTRRAWGISPKGLDCLRDWKLYKETCQARNFLMRHTPALRRRTEGHDVPPPLPEWPLA